MKLEDLRHCVELAETLEESVNELDLTDEQRRDWAWHNEHTVSGLRKMLSREEAKRIIVLIRQSTQETQNP